VPAYFPAADFELLLRLEGDAGARELLQGARSIPQKDLIVDIDTEEDFRAAQILFEK
jgi:molybdenum cofactor cytidylyltransferase